MLRLAVLILLLANAGYYAWSQGLLRAWGLAPATQSEPERLERPLNPDALKLLPAQSPPPAETAALPQKLRYPAGAWLPKLGTKSSDLEPFCEHFCPPPD